MILRLVRFFPLHHQQIISIAKKLPPESKEAIFIAAASAYDSLKVFEDFLDDEDISLEAKGKALFEAAYRGNSKIVERLLEKESIPYWNKFLQGYYDISGISSDNFNSAIGISANGVS